MWRTHFVNANPATIMQRLYQIKAEQDGRDVVIIAHAVRRDEVPAESAGEKVSRDAHGCPSVGVGAGRAAFAPTERAAVKEEVFA